MSLVAVIYNEETQRLEFIRSNGTVSRSIQRTETGTVYCMYAEDGQRLVRTEVEDDGEAGTYVYKYYADGRTVYEEGRKIGDTKTGWWVHHRPDGILSAKVRFADGKMDFAKVYDHKGLLERKGPMKDGDADGCWHYYNQAGTLTSEQEHESGAITHIRNYRPDGTLGNEYPCVNGVAHGMALIYYQDGKTVMQQMEMVGGVHRGAFILYNPEGKVRVACDVLGDNVHGAVVQYDDQEQIIWAGQRMDGRTNAQQAEWLTGELQMQELRENRIGMLSTDRALRDLDRTRKLIVRDPQLN